MYLDRARNVLLRGSALLLVAIFLSGGMHASTTPQRAHLLSFYFQNIEVKSLLQLIARNSGLNFIISDAVKGNITLNLQNVTWEEALRTILETQGLASRRIDNVIYINTIENITSNEAKQLQSRETLAGLAPLESEMVHLKYTDAAKLGNLLKGTEGTLLTNRGQIAIDGRTNSLIIRDTRASIDSILTQIKKLDIPARQVLIEARIVNIDSFWENELGVRFGVSNTRHLSGTFAGANALANGTSASAISPETNRLNFNIPARSLFDGSTPGSGAMALARLGPVLLDLELSALEGEKHAQVIARPRVVTSNQEKAVIQTGEEIPYQEATSSGATSVVFKKAVLSLEIVPQITPDNKIVLNLKATEDTRGQNIAVGATSTAGSSGSSTPVTIPAINTESVESSVLLNNNETIVIGGVYKNVKENSVDRVPFFSDLPVIGHLFRFRDDYSEKHELLIFITPKIIEDNVSVAGDEKPHKSRKQAPWKEQL